MQQEEDTCMCTASLKTNKSIEMKTKIEGRLNRRHVFLCAYLFDRQWQQE